MYTLDDTEFNFDVPYTEESMEEISIQRDGITKQLQSIKNRKSPGPEGISARVLKELAPQIAPYLEIIFKKSLSEGKLPLDWKIASVTPIFKKGTRHDPGNYRPISLTSIIGKILEHIVVSNIMIFLDRRNFMAVSTNSEKVDHAKHSSRSFFKIFSLVNRKDNLTHYF